MVNNDDDWTSNLEEHPMFSNPTHVNGDKNFELSLKPFADRHTIHEGHKTPTRRQLMCLKDGDLIVASGSEIRMASMNDAKASGSEKTYKILHTPSIDFKIHQICLSPNRKLLAIAGSHQVAVVVLPRNGFSKLVTARIDCKSLLIGPDYHNSAMPPVAKIDWHPWGESSSTFLVMTIDGKLREYDVSFDPDEPRKLIDFFPDKKRSIYAAVDTSEREVASFTFGKGKADWGPLTIYALMKSGDIYAFCPYLPENALIPSSFMHGLECYVSAKQEFVSEHTEILSDSFSTLYDYQRKYVNALLRQFPDGTVFPSSSRLVLVHPPKSFTYKPMRQGPFLLQPSPIELKDTPGGDATDILYLPLGDSLSDDEDGMDSSSPIGERLGVLLVAHQDGRVDICLDLEKIEAKWEIKQLYSKELPMFAVYETVDLGLISTLRGQAGSNESTLDILLHNYPAFYTNPIDNDTIYVYHAFGVHALDIGPILQTLSVAIKQEDERILQTSLQKPANSSVRAILSTFSVESRSSLPVVAVTIPDDVYLTYSIFILTASMRFVSFSLNFRTETLDPQLMSGIPNEISTLPPLPPSDPPAYVSLLKTQEISIPEALQRPMGFPSIAKLSLPKSQSVKSEFVLTPETLRYLAVVAERISGEVNDVLLANRSLHLRVDFQRSEFERLQAKAYEASSRVKILMETCKEIESRTKVVQDRQKDLIDRLDTVLRRLINKASPELNEHEKQWFGELERMKVQVMGAGRYDQTSLKMRVELLQKDFNRLLPTLQELATKDLQRKTEIAENQGSGFPYTRAYERLTREEQEKLESAIRQVVTLAGKLDISTVTHRSE